MIKINPDWTLFLDRDGVINRRLPDDYVKRWSEFEFMPGAPEAIAMLSTLFGRIFVVTNQQGIGKGLMSTEDLQAIHQQMAQEIKRAGGRIDGIYFCPHLHTDGCNCRKPRPGMAWQALADFPAIDFSHAIMVGDTPGDIEFGHNVGMRAAFVAKPTELPPPHTNWQFPSLFNFAQYLICCQELGAHAKITSVAP